jgi:large subunit ribosomal protein L22
MSKAIASKTESTAKLVKASARYLHISPRKMRLVTNLVKNMSALDALVQLQHANKKASPMVAKLLNSAIANAKNNFSIDPESLVVKSITADQGPVMKRYFSRARGSAFVIRRKMCHVNIVLEEQKHGKSKSSHRSLLVKVAKPEEKSQISVDQKEATETRAPKSLGKKSQVGKTTEEQVKQNKAQNKRRLFNRKAGV